MRVIQLNYRVKLNKDFIFKHPLFNLIERDGLTEDCDIQLLDEKGEVIADFENASLRLEDSFEGRTTLYLADDLPNSSIKNEFLYGTSNMDYRPFIVNSSKVFNFSIYEGEIGNTFYITRGDLQEFSSDYSLEVANVLRIYFEYYLLFYGGVMNPEIINITLSEDKKVCKVKTRGFYRLDDVNLDSLNKLNRILPS